jgi:uncharacterized membrane protein YfcA
LVEIIGRRRARFGKVAGRRSRVPVLRSASTAGTFGAGIGILMLAALSILGVVGIHRMNGLKNLFALCINGSAAIYFLAAGMVHWRYALLMAVGAIVGGYACAGFARRMSAQAVRRVVILIGLGMALSLLIAKK